MIFSLYVDARTWLGWSDKTGQVRIYGHPLDLVARVQRASDHALPIGGVRGNLDTPWDAFRLMTGALRERAGAAGPIVFTGLDDDGLEIPFIPEPDADGSHL